MKPRLSSSMLNAMNTSISATYGMSVNPSESFMKDAHAASMNPPRTTDSHAADLLGEPPSLLSACRRIAVLRIREVHSHDPRYDDGHEQPSERLDDLVEQDDAREHGHHGAGSDPDRVAGPRRETSLESHVEEHHARRQEDEEQDVVQYVGESVGELHA